MLQQLEMASSTNTRQVALITSVDSPFSLRCLVELAKQGIAVVANISDSTEKREELLKGIVSIVEGIREGGGIASVTVFPPEQGQELLATVLEHFGRIDLLINNTELLADECSHPKTTFNCQENCHPLRELSVINPIWQLMQLQGSGKILNVSQGVDSAVYGGVAEMTKRLADEGAAKGIQVNSLIAGESEAIELADQLVQHVATDNSKITGQLFCLDTNAILKPSKRRTLSAILTGSLQPSIEAIFSKLKESLPEYGPALVKQCKSHYGFQLTTPSGEEKKFTLDLSSGIGDCYPGFKSEPNCLVIMQESDLVDYFLRKVTLESLFKAQKMKVKYSTGRATRLRIHLFPEFTERTLAQQPTSKL